MKIYQNSTKLGKNVGIFIGYTPLLKALMCGINAVGAQGSGCMFTFYHAPLKTALLLHKMAKVPYSFSETVCYSSSKNANCPFL